MSGIDADLLARACSEVGATIVDPSVWPQIMQRICNAVGATGASLLQADERTSDLPQTDSVRELFSDYFKNKWHMRDIRAQRGAPLFLAGATVVIDQDILTPEQIKRDPFYNECCLPHGFHWFGGVKVLAGSTMWAFVIQRTAKEGPFEPVHKGLIETLARPMTEAATLSQAVGRAALASTSNALEFVNQAAIAIDRSGFVLDANSAAEGMFGEDLYIKNRRLFSIDRQAQSSLQQVIDRLRTTPDTEPLPTEPVVVRRIDDTPVVIRILPVHGAARNPFVGARALLILSSIKRKLGLDAALLMKIFRLTPAEARLALLMSEGTSPEIVAEQLGIARVTARNQLKAVFAKTGTHRQGELVATLARL